MKMMVYSQKWPTPNIITGSVVHLHKISCHCFLGGKETKLLRNRWLLFWNSRPEITTVCHIFLPGFSKTGNLQSLINKFSFQNGNIHIFRREIYYNILYLLYISKNTSCCLKIFKVQRVLELQIRIKNDFLNVYKGLLWITIYSIQVYYLYESVLGTKLLVSANLTWHLMIIIHHSRTGQRLF